MRYSNPVVLTLALAAGTVHTADQPQQRALPNSGRAPLVIAPAEAFECEALLPKAVISTGPAAVQPMHSFGDQWSGAAQLFWRPPAPVDTPIRNWPHLRLHPKVAKAGKYRVALAYTVAPDYGTLRVFVRGKPVKDLNGYAGAVDLRRVELGEFTLPAGTAEFVFTVFGKDAKSSNYFVGLDRIELWEAP